MSLRDDLIEAGAKALDGYLPHYSEHGAELVIDAILDRLRQVGRQVQLASIHRRYEQTGMADWIVLSDEVTDADVGNVFLLLPAAVLRNPGSSDES